MDTHVTHQPGDIVYVMIRNPHAQSAAHVQQAAVVRHPDHPDQLALFLYETYYPLNEDIAVYTSQHEAEAAYQAAFGFGMMEADDYDG